MDADLRNRKIIDELSLDFPSAKDRAISAGEWVLNLGLYFLGTPYAAGTLDNEGPETLVINLRKFDCFTFVENIIALAQLLQSDRLSFDHYPGNPGMHPLSPGPPGWVCFPPSLFLRLAFR